MRDIIQLEYFKRVELMINIIVYGSENELEPLISHISRQDDMTIKGITDDNARLASIVKKASANIVIMNLQKENKDSVFDTASAVTQALPEVKIIMISDCAEDEVIIDAYYAGAVDYILKSGEFEPLISSIREVHSKHDFLGPLIVQHLHSELTKYKTMHESLLFFINSFSRLTPAEKTVLKELYFGKTRQQLAEDHFLSITTVHTHVKHILRKLGFSSTKTLLAFLRRIQLFENFNI